MAADTPASAALWWHAYGAPVAGLAEEADGTPAPAWMMLIVGECTIPPDGDTRNGHKITDPLSHSDDVAFCHIWRAGTTNRPRPKRKRSRPRSTAMSDAPAGASRTSARRSPPAAPRYVLWDRLLSNVQVCQDCGALVVDEAAHTRFHSILGSHGWTLAVLQNTHLSATTHDRYDAVERIKRRTFDNWSADAFAEVMAEQEVPE